MQLNRTGSAFTRTERNETNENWGTIETEFNNVVDTVSNKAYEQVVDSAKLIWQTPVDTYEDIATTYPIPEEGWAVMARQDSTDYPTGPNDQRKAGTVWRYKGTEWKAIQQIDPTMINEVENRLNQKINNDVTSLDQKIDDSLNSVDQQLEGVKNNKSDKVDVALKGFENTSQGKWWSDSVEELKVDLNNGDKIVKTIPKQYKETVVFLGSSTTEGNGPADIEDSWFNLYESKLSDDYICYNRGYGGNSTQDVIDRFYKDVTPLNPDFVFIQLTIGNEGIYSATDKQAVYDQFLNNIIKIARMVYQIGATPIIIGQAPTKHYNTVYYRMGNALNDTLSTMGYYVVNIMGNLAPQTSPWYSELIMKDNLHYNELGQTLIESAIPPTLLKHVHHAPKGDIKSRGGVVTVNNPSTETPMIYRKPENDDMKSFTFFTKLKVNNLTKAQSIASFNNMARIALSSANDRFIIYDDNSEIFNDFLVAYMNEWISIGFVYSDLEKIIRFYINGELAETFENTNVALSVLNIGGRETSSATIEDAEFSDITLYRTALTNKQVLNLHLGSIPQSSLEIYAPLVDNMINPSARLTNLAPTDAALIVPAEENGVWKKVTGF